MELSTTVLCIIWGVMALVFLAVELATISLVSIWFTAGCAAGLILALMGRPLWAQIAGFALVSLISWLIGRKWVIRSLNYKPHSLQKDLRGMTGQVSQEIPEGGKGRIVVEGQDWQACSLAGPIQKGTMVRILDLQGVTLTVMPAEDETERKELL